MSVINEIAEAARGNSIVLSTVLESPNLPGLKVMVWSLGVSPLSKDGIVIVTMQDRKFVGWEMRQESLVRAVRRVRLLMRIKEMQSVAA